MVEGCAGRQAGGPRRSTRLPLPAALVGSTQRGPALAPGLGHKRPPPSTTHLAAQRLLHRVHCHGRVLRGEGGGGGGHSTTGLQRRVAASLVQVYGSPPTTTTSPYPKK